MPVNILMPALSPTMEKGNLAKWLKKEGDKVKAGDVIAEIETDKATMEVEAVDEGTLGKIVVPAGTQDVPVNQVIAVLLEEGEDASAMAKAVKPAPKAAPKAAQPKSETKMAIAPSPSPQPSPQRGEGVVSAQAAKPQFTTSPLGGEVGAPAAPTSAKREYPARQEKTGPPGEGVRTNGQGARIFASPLARRIAKESGIELAELQGSGPHGRIVVRDIEQAKGGAMRAPASVAGGSPIQAPSDGQIRALYEDGSYDFVPHDAMRKTIARRLMESKLTIPHYYLTVDVELDALMQARGEINASAPKGPDGKPRYRLSVNDFIIKALALALLKVPDANVTWLDAGMLRHRHADIGVAVAIPGGLITPVVRRADEKTVTVISNELRDLVARARAKKLKPHEYQGGSTAVSNLGMYGIREFSAVINPPHATILAVGAGEERAVARNGKLAVATEMTVTLSADHRAVDGALGAELLTAFKGYMEKPVGLVA